MIKKKEIDEAVEKLCDIYAHKPVDIHKIKTILWRVHYEGYNNGFDHALGRRN